MIVTLLLNQYKLIKEIRCVDINQIISIEKRILTSLFVLSENVDSSEAEPVLYSDTFIYLAKRLLNKDSEIQTLACQSACQFLNEYGFVKDDMRSECATATYDVICLFSSEQMQHQLYLSYKNLKSLRASIFSIWTKQSYLVKESIIKNASVQKYDNSLKAELISYKAHGYSDDVLLDSYTHNSNNSEIVLAYEAFTDIEKKCFTDSIFQSLYLKNNLAHDVLEAILKEQKLDKGLLKLASLTGDNRYLSYLVDYSNIDPDSGYYYLALHGSYGAASEIINGFNDVRSIACCAQAWFLLTGMKIPMKARLSIVSKDEDNINPENQSPDVSKIEKWWLDNKEKLKTDKRWILGKVHCLKEIVSALTKFSGEFNQDLLSMYKLEVEEADIFDLDDGWYINKHKRYKALENSIRLNVTSQKITTEYA